MNKEFEAIMKLKTFKPNHDNSYYRKNIITWMLAWTAAHSKQNLLTDPIAYFLALNTMITAKTILKDRGSTEFKALVQDPLIDPFSTYVESNTDVQDLGHFTNKIKESMAIANANPNDSIEDFGTHLSADFDDMVIGDEINSLIDCMLYLSVKYNKEPIMLQALNTILDMVSTMNNPPKNIIKLLTSPKNAVSPISLWIYNICKLLDKALALKKIITNKGLILSSDSHTTSMKCPSSENKGCAEGIANLNNAFSSVGFNERIAISIIISSLIYNDNDDIMIDKYLLFTRTDKIVVKFGYYTIKEIENLTDTIHMPRVFFTGDLPKEYNSVLTGINMDELQKGNTTLYSNVNSGSLLTIYAGNIYDTSKTSNSIVSGNIHMFYSPALAAIDKLIQCTLTYAPTAYYGKNINDLKWYGFTQQTQIQNNKNSTLSKLLQEYSLFLEDFGAITKLRISEVEYHFDSINMKLTPLSLQSFICLKKVNLSSTETDHVKYQEEVHNQIRKQLQNNDFYINGIRLRALFEYNKIYEKKVKNNSINCINSQLKNTELEPYMTTVVDAINRMDNTSIAIFNNELDDFWKTKETVVKNAT